MNREPWFTEVLRCAINTGFTPRQPILKVLLTDLQIYSFIVFNKCLKHQKCQKYAHINLECSLHLHDINICLSFRICYIVHLSLSRIIFMNRFAVHISNVLSMTPSRGSTEHCCSCCCTTTTTTYTIILYCTWQLTISTASHLSIYVIVRQCPPG